MRTPNYFEQNPMFRVDNSRKVPQFTRLMCRSCIHRRQPFGEHKTCDAFPDGIPADILSREFDHRTTHPDQKNKVIWEYDISEKA